MYWRNAIMPPALLLFALFFVQGIAATAPVFTVRMNGQAEGIGLTARKLAIEDAQQQAMIDVLQAMTNATDMAPFRTLLRQTPRYVQRYDLLVTEVVGQTTIVEVDVHIFEQPLRHDVAAIMLPRLPRAPKVLLIIAEYIGPEAETGGPTFHIAESVFRERIKDFDFELTGIESLLDHYDVRQLLDVINGDISKAAAFARANQADVILIGSAETTHEPLVAESNMMRNRATVVLRAFAGSDGKMTDVISAQAVVQSVDIMAGGTQAVQDACGKLAAESIVAIVLTMLGLEDESRVIVEAVKPGTLDHVRALMTAIQHIPGVHGAEILFFSESLARLAVDYAGGMAAFSDNISGTVVGGRTVEVTRCIKREMTVIFQ